MLLGARLLPEGKGRAVSWQDLTKQTGPLVILRSDHRLFRSQEGLARFLKGARASGSAPGVDFSTHELLFVSVGPRSSTGYSVQVLSARDDGGTINVRVSERTPGLNEHVEPHVTYPYRLLSLPAGQDVYVDWLGR
ncbi:MAG: protease complex subunit PrcB family protein [Actinomycetota bacterium]